MLNKTIPTAALVYLKDIEEHKPDPRAAKLLMLSKYGVLRIGTPVEGYDVAWSELPKIPNSVKDKMCRMKNSESC